MSSASGRAPRGAGTAGDRGPAVVVELDPPLTPALVGALVGCWADVTNAGGAVGFVPPVTVADVRPLAEASFARLAAAGGEDHLVVLRAEGDGAVAGWCVLESRGIPLSAHWRTLKRVQVHPSRQGQGYGAALVRAAEAAARGLGLEALHLTARGGTGVDRFYAALGYREVGRIPRALRVAPGDDRDEIYMVRLLEEDR